MIGFNAKLEDEISSTLYDLTHLEINIIIKDEMTATKAPSSPRLIVHALATTYYTKLIELGEKYQKHLNLPLDKGVTNLFRGVEEHLGSGYESFHELTHRAESAAILIRNIEVKLPISENDVKADIMMLNRIKAISNDIRSILKLTDTVKGDPVEVEENPAEKRDSYLFDLKGKIAEFRTMGSNDADKLELFLDLRQLMVIKKANDIGIEKVVMQTVIGMDGDITTRVTQSFADQPVPFIQTLHHEAIGISVDFWKILINVVVELGKNFIGMLSKNG